MAVALDFSDQQKTEGKAKKHGFVSNNKETPIDRSNK
jgi:hypothetical protein